MTPSIVRLPFAGLHLILGKLSLAEAQEILENLVATGLSEFRYSVFTFDR